jgi:hypothetical protein
MGARSLVACGNMFAGKALKLKAQRNGRRECHLMPYKTTRMNMY